MEIKKILKQDLAEVVEVHKNSFNGFFLTELGDKFLATYYNSLIKDQRAVLLGMYDEENLLGFCAGTYLSKGYNTYLIRNNLLSYFIVGIKILFSKPIAIFHLVKNLSKGGNSNIEDNGEYAELLSIAVINNKQGKGIGKKLLLELENEMKLKGCFKLSLTTDFYNNIKVIEFYKGLGYNIYYEFIAYPNRKMYRMIKDLQE
ncbi:MAG: GNAT family N-acetyltransferase [Paludibacter sp.]